MVKNVLLKIAYDGTNFHGYQHQDDLRTVEDVLKAAINKVTGEDNRIIAAGRTDSGVHAVSQYVNFLTASNISPRAFNFHLDPLLPDDLQAIEAREVDLNFHARFSAVDKTYKYIIYTEKIMHPVYRNYMEHVTYPLDLEQLQRGLDLLKGEHDFKAFMRADKELAINTIRTIDDCYYEDHADRLEIYFRANSFLHNQVRIMVGSLIELARGRLSIEDYKRFFDQANSKRANPALGPQGLYLWSINYD